MLSRIVNHDASVTDAFNGNDDDVVIQKDQKDHLGINSNANDDVVAVLTTNSNTGVNNWNSGMAPLFGAAPTAALQAKSGGGHSSGSGHSSGGGHSGGARPTSHPAPSPTNRPSPSQSRPAPTPAHPAPSTPPGPTQTHPAPAPRPSTPQTTPRTEPAHRDPGTPHTEPAPSSAERRNPPGQGPHNPPGQGSHNPPPHGNPPGQGPHNPPGQGPRYDRRPDYPPPHYHHEPPRLPPAYHHWHDYWYDNRAYYQHYTYYRPWYGSVNIIYVGGYPRYDWDRDQYSGAGFNVNTVQELREEKEGPENLRGNGGVDGAFYDLNPASPFYREDVQRVVNSYGYLLSQVFAWGNSHPYDAVFYNPTYRGLIEGIWTNIKSALRTYESWTGDDWLRRDMTDVLYYQLCDSNLANDGDYYDQSFYERLVEEIRVAG